MPKLPAHLVSVADQAKAEADARVNAVVEELRRDLAQSDSVCLWWTLAHNWTHLTTPHELAAALASAALRLAQEG